jgi:hypothetical protein
MIDRLARVGYASIGIVYTIVGEPMECEGSASAFRFALFESGGVASALQKLRDLRTRFPPSRFVDDRDLPLSTLIRVSDESALRHGLGGRHRIHWAAVEALQPDRDNFTGHGL